LQIHVNITKKNIIAKVLKHILWISSDEILSGRRTNENATCIIYGRVRDRAKTMLHSKIEKRRDDFNWRPDERYNVGIGVE